jgi:hypothetical protein
MEKGGAPGAGPGEPTRETLTQRVPRSGPFRGSSNVIRDEAIATVSVGWRFFVERLYRHKPDECAILGVGRHGGRLHIRSSPPPPEYQAHIQEIERLSTRTYEDCGGNGGRHRELSRGSAVLCDACQMLRGSGARGK